MRGAGQPDLWTQGPRSPLQGQMVLPSPGGFLCVEDIHPSSVLSQKPAQRFQQEGTELGEAFKGLQR